MSEGLPPILWVTGPPGAGKSTLCEEILKCFSHGFHLSVDDLRTAVKVGLADSVPWTEETERQFQVAEAASCDIARRYQASGFAVAIDHCRNLPRLDELISAHLTGLPVVKICLLPDLNVNLQRNLDRKNKPFDPAVLSETIRFTSDKFRQDVGPGWHVLDNSALSVDDSVRWVREHIPIASHQKA